MERLTDHALMVLIDDDFEVIDQIEIAADEKLSLSAVIAKAAEIGDFLIPAFNFYRDEELACGWISANQMRRIQSIVNEDGFEDHMDLCPAGLIRQWHELKPFFMGASRLMFCDLDMENPEVPVAYLRNLIWGGDDG